MKTFIFRPISRRVATALVALAGAATFTTTAALAQSQFPSRSITMIVPFPPGGPTDLVARVIAQKLSGSPMDWSREEVVGIYGAIGDC